MIKKLCLSLVACFALISGLPVNADWHATLQPDKTYVCTADTEAEKIACIAETGVLTWFIGTPAEAQAVAGVIRGYVTPSTIGSPPPPPPSLHSPWAQCDVSSPVTAGNAFNGGGVGGTMTVAGTGDVGNNNGNNTYKTHVAYQSFTGPVDVITQVTSITAGFDYRKGGISFNNSSCSNASPWAAVSVNLETTGAQQGAAFILNNFVNGRAQTYSTGTSGPLPPPQWVRLTYDGTIVSGYYGSSSTGPWTLIDSEARALPGTYYINIFCASANLTDPQLATCLFTEPIITVLGGNTGTISMVSSSQTVVENAGSFTVCANRGGGTSGAASVVVSATGGTATGSDWTTGDLPQTLNWGNGVGSQKCTTAIHVTNRAGTQGSRTIVTSLGTFTGSTAGVLTADTITIQDAVTVTAQKKWHPGYYLDSYRGGNYYTRLNQSARFSEYDSQANTPFAGWIWFSTWSQLEGATHGDYAAGDALLQAEIAHLKAEPNPKRFMLLLDDELYGGSTSMYPAYIISAGCEFTEPWNGPPAGVPLYHFKWWVPVCAGYMADLVTHLGSLLDNEPYFEEIELDYEQAVINRTASGFNAQAHLAGVNTVMQAAAAAFPHTNIGWLANWGWTNGEAELVQELGYAKVNHIGWGDEDSCAVRPHGTAGAGSYFSDGSMPTYIDADNIFRGYGGFDTGHNAGTYTDQRDKMFTSWGVEDSELGYQSVCGLTTLGGGTGTYFVGSYQYTFPDGSMYPITFFSLYNWWNDSLHATHVHLDQNQEVGFPEQRWTVGRTSSLWDMVINHPITHTACPTDYDTAFGNGSAGSGCNTN